MEQGSRSRGRPKRSRSAPLRLSFDSAPLPPRLRPAPLRLRSSLRARAHDICPVLYTIAGRCQTAQASTARSIHAVSASMTLQACENLRRVNALRASAQACGHEGERKRGFATKPRSLPPLYGLPALRKARPLSASRQRSRRRVELRLEGVRSAGQLFDKPVSWMPS